MAKKARKTDTEISRLQAENERLQAENERLRQDTQSVVSPERRTSSTAQVFRRIGVVVFTLLAVLLLAAGNLLFWTGNTVVQNDRFTEAVSPVIRQPAVQQSLADYTTKQLYANVDVTRYVQDALPPRAEFLAPSVAGQLEGYTQKTLDKVAANQKFQTTWNEVVARAHARFITTVKQSGGNGVIDLNDLYRQLSASLKNTRLSFLADKQLPEKVGSIQLVSGQWIQVLHNVTVNIDTWRWLAIILFLICAALAVYLSRRRRRAVARTALLCAVGLFVSLVAVRIARETVADRVQPAYAEGARQALQVVLHPLVVQTSLLLAVFALIAAVGWLVGTSHSAAYVQARIQFLLAGKLHQALFGIHENALTRWIGHYKRQLQWGVVVLAAVLLLITHLTFMTLIGYAVLAAVLVLVIELLGAPKDA